jgi:RNA polymerase sigma factor (sigma-70 family)
VPRYPDQSDEQLLRQARAGDPWAFDEFYRRHQRWVLTYLARRTDSPETAADLMAEVFAALLVRLKHRTPPNAPGPWLVTVAQNKVSDFYRRGRLEASARERLSIERVAIEDTDLQLVVEIAATTDLLEEVRRLLPEDQAAALEARILHERSYTEIAATTRSSQAAVRQRVSRALGTLRTKGGLGHD